MIKIKLVLKRTSIVLAILSTAFTLISPPAARASLYSFTSHIFTPCGKSGSTGPLITDCQSAYSSTSWKSNTALFNVSSGIQLWTVPSTGTYRITAAGAEGGNGKQIGGKGATISGEFTLTQGSILKILVGQEGVDYAQGSGGGGGGSFVVSNSNSPLIIAGGGGGGGGSTSNIHVGGSGSFTTNASAATQGGGGGSASSGGAGDTVSYAGGGGGSGTNGVHGGNAVGGGGGLGAAGGAGFGGSGGLGQNDTVVPKSFLLGGAGGYRSSNNWGNINTSFGGFGGGGNGTAHTYESGGGGGGGYSGGGGGTGLRYGGGGGGGGSYNAGANAVNINQTHADSGQVEIVLLVSDLIAPTITSSTSFSVDENSTSIATLTANETSTWLISGGIDSATVSVESITGLLSFKSSQNYETPSDYDGDGIYLFNVQARDAAGNTTLASITVTINDLNEAPVITSNGGGSTAAIFLNENSRTITTVSAQDPDTATSLVFSISGVDSTYIAIDSASGLLTFIDNPNFESPSDSDSNNIYTVVVTVSDNYLSDTQTIAITIGDLVESVELRSINFSSPPVKGKVNVITAQFETAGKVTFFVSGKRIAGCISKSTTTVAPFQISCSWKPATSGLLKVELKIVPTSNTFNSTLSPSINANVMRRTNLR